VQFTLAPARGLPDPASVTLPWITAPRGKTTSIECSSAPLVQLNARSTFRYGCPWGGTTPVPRFIVPRRPSSYPKLWSKIRQRFRIVQEIVSSDFSLAPFPSFPPVNYCLRRALFRWVQPVNAVPTMLHVKVDQQAGRVTARFEAGDQLGLLNVSRFHILTSLPNAWENSVKKNCQQEAKRLRGYPHACKPVNMERNRPAALGRTAWRFERRRSGMCRGGGMSGSSDERRHPHPLGHRARRLRGR
jgi:hypothetical protein